jgi:hypothetical protein
VVHVDDSEVGMPIGEDCVGMGKVVCGLDNEQAMVQGELDEIHHERAIVEHKRASGFGAIGA